MALALGLSILTLLVMQGYVRGEELGISKRSKYSGCFEKYCESSNRRPCLLDHQVHFTSFEIIRSRTKTLCSLRGVVSLSERQGEVWVRGGCSALLKVCYRRQKGHCKIVNCTSKTELKHRKICVVKETRQIVKVEVMQKQMKKHCEGQFGHYDNIIFIKGKCSGDFKVCYRPKLDPCEGRSKTVYCSDSGKHLNTCRVSHHRVIASADIISEDMQSACVPGRKGNYGWIRNKLWVTEGCRATFRVCLKESKYLTLPNFFL